LRKRLDLILMRNKIMFSVVWVLLQIVLANATSNEKFHPFPNSCMDLFVRGRVSDGYYQIAGAGGETWIVYCDFNSELGSVWTLVTSWSLENKNMPAFRSKTFTQDAPVNELSPNWNVYRMSKEQMKYLQAESTHWRATCQFDKEDVDYRDYMRGNFADFDITSFRGARVCQKVDYINIRGIAGHTTATFWQLENSNFLHLESYYSGCEFDATAGAAPSEDNFGFYDKINDAFSCTSGPSATTQYWFGSYI